MGHGIWDQFSFSDQRVNHRLVILLQKCVDSMKMVKSYSVKYGVSLRTKYPNHKI